MLDGEAIAGPIEQRSARLTARQLLETRSATWDPTSTASLDEVLERLARRPEPPD